MRTPPSSTHFIDQRRADSIMARSLAPQTGRIHLSRPTTHDKDCACKRAADHTIFHTPDCDGITTKPAALHQQSPWYKRSGRPSPLFHLIAGTARSEGRAGAFPRVGYGISGHEWP